MPASFKNFAALSGGKTAQFRASLRVFGCKARLTTLVLLF
jgi:hypothetical protein